MSFSPSRRQTRKRSNPVRHDQADHQPQVKRQRLIIESDFMGSRSQGHGPKGVVGAINFPGFSVHPHFPSWVIHFAQVKHSRAGTLGAQLDLV